MPATLRPLLTRAFDARAALLEQLHAESTNAYRLFHGSVEGLPGLTIDRYGDLLLVQAFHTPLNETQLQAVQDYYADVVPGLTVIYNDRSQGNSRIRNELAPELQRLAEKNRKVQEMGVSYRIRARHQGQDPWLFLDLRAGRRRVMQEAAGKTVLNLFAYTCGVGIAAAKAGASLVQNIDFAESSLAVGKENAKLNEISKGVRFLQCDAFAALRQLSGLGQPRVVRGHRLPPFPKVEQQQFDLVFLDPPRYAKSAFGVVDLVNDYPALFKPALLSTAPGGAILCCNNVAQVEREGWLDQLQRSASKVGRPVQDVEWIMPETDFPSSDGQPPLKMVLLRV